MDKISVYVCNAGHRTITRKDRDLKGITPIMILCRAKDCKCDAVKQMHNGHNGLPPEWEWYKPTDELVKIELRSMNLSKREYDEAYQRYKQYVTGGTLLLRKIEKL